MVACIPSKIFWYDIRKYVDCSQVVDSFLLRNSFRDVDKYELSTEEYAEKKGLIELALTLTLSYDQ